LRIAREAAVPATIHHLKTAYRQNGGRMPQVLARLERARAEGIDVAADQYPYVAASNRLDSNLPVWAREGGREALIARLEDPATRARIKADVLRADPTWENQYLGSGGASGLLIANLDKPELRSYQGRRLDEIGRASEKNDVTARDENEIVGPGTRPPGLPGRPDRVQPLNGQRSLHVHGSEGVQRGRAVRDGQRRARGRRRSNDRRTALTTGIWTWVSRRALNEAPATTVDLPGDDGEAAPTEVRCEQANVNV
jgi:hypothetical protein